MDPAAWLRDPRFTPAIGAVTKRLLAAADALYARADSGIAGLPWDCRPGIGAARRLYAEIGAEIARNGYDSVSRRAVVPGHRKLALLGRAAVTGLLPGEADAQPALAACRDLVLAAAVPARRPRAPASITGLPGCSTCSPGWSSKRSAGADGGPVGVDYPAAAGAVPVGVGAGSHRRAIAKARADAPKEK